MYGGVENTHRLDWTWGGLAGRGTAPGNRWVPRSSGDAGRGTWLPPGAGTESAEEAPPLTLPFPLYRTRRVVPAALPATGPQGRSRLLRGHCGSAGRFPETAPRPSPPRGLPATRRRCWSPECAPAPGTWQRARETPPTPTPLARGNAFGRRRSSALRAVRSKHGGRLTRPGGAGQGP